MVRNRDLNSILETVKDRTVAVIGYNVPGVVLHLSNHAKNIAGFEFDKDIYATNIKNPAYANLTLFRRHIMNGFDFKDIDTIVLVGAEHMRLDAEQEHVANECKRVLKSKGIFHIMYNNLIIFTDIK